MVGFSSLFWVGQPGFDGNHDLVGDAERVVDELMLLLREGALPDLEKLTTRRRQNRRDNLVSGELFAQGRPRGMNLFAQKAGFDRDQQVIGQHAQKDVSLHSILEVMEDRSLPEWTFEIAKRSEERRVGKGCEAW